MQRHDEFGIDRLTLRFPAVMEQEYDRDRQDGSLFQIRVGLLAVAVVIASALISLALVDPNVDDFWRLPSARLALNWSTILAVLMALAITMIRPTGRSVALATMLVSLWFLSVIVIQVILDPSTTSFLGFLPILGLILFACTVVRIDFVLCLPFCILAVAAIGLAVLGRPHPASAIEAFVYFLASASLAVVAGYCLERQARRVFVLRHRLAAEHERSESLLLNVLPKPIADRLRAGEGTIADRFDQCSVLFADVVGYTEIAAQMSPEEAVMHLNYVFSAFDDLADTYGLEKIKTIGDAYMVVGGVPTPKADYLHAMAEMALDLRVTIARLNREKQWDLAMRIGIATGPVVAGVIGQRKFAYDLWGDTVNTASRMESHGVPGTIQVTDDVYQLLKNDFVFEARGDIEVKGKGTMRTYLLLRRVAGAAQFPELHAIPS